LLRRQVVHGAQSADVDASRLLGSVHFGRTGHLRPPGQGLALRVPLDGLDDHTAAIDLWSGAAPVRVERAGNVELATDGRSLFGYLRVDEEAAGGLRAAAREAYASIFAILDQSLCSHPLRFWNYVPHINRELDGLERYRHFNIGRQEAFLASGRSAFAGAPAACAIGTEAGGLTIYFVAAREAPTPIENPRQVSAYHYPTEHGPRTPTFSRATLVTGGRPMLFLSGTASVVGHRSEHPGDVAAQTRESFVNVRTLVDAANGKFSAPPFAIDRLAYTVYVRHAADYERVRRQFTVEVGATSTAAQQAVFLKGDICRAELLVEIEATGSLI
jgi:chorismate lyase/3-hydroxybenzoate synthase